MHWRKDAVGDTVQPTGDSFRFADGERPHVVVDQGAADADGTKVQFAAVEQLVDRVGDGHGKRPHVVIDSVDAADTDGTAVQLAAVGSWTVPELATTNDRTP